MSKEEQVEVVRQEKKDDNPKTAYFFQRMAAYLIDIFLVSMVVTLITFPLPKNENLTKINQEIMDANKQYLDKEIKAEEYINKSIGLSRDAAYENVTFTIIDLTVTILYFIVFQFYNNGQTLGKKLLHIRLVKWDHSKLAMNDILVRSLIIHAIFINMITLAFTLFANDTIYFYSSNLLALLQSLILIVTVVMVAWRKDKRGLHDVICNTKVIVEN